MMKSSLILTATIFSLQFSELAQAQVVKAKKVSANVTNYANVPLSTALEMVKSGQNDKASLALFNLARKPEFAANKAQIKYILGLTLMELKMYQTAAFQLVDVIRLGDKKYSPLAIDKLTIAADQLGDDTILNYAFNRLDTKNIGGENKDMLQYRYGEYRMRARDFAGALEAFKRVPPGSTYYNQALYNIGLASLEQNQVDAGVEAFKQLLELRKKSPATDMNRVAAQIGLARALYQKQDWEASITAYAEVPRDHVLWHDAQLEQSWAMLRAAKFRSALSNFHSLHSSYYEDRYNPESFLLRAIVYLYICKYDEMDKVLNLYEKTYGPVRRSITNFMSATNDAAAFYNEVEKAQTVRKGAAKASMQFRLPYLVVRSLTEEGEVKRGLEYIKHLNEERATIQKYAVIRDSGLGKYAFKILNTRTRNAKFAIGDAVKAQLLNMKQELKDLYEQASFIRYEMIAGKKEVVRKKVVNPEADAPAPMVDDKVDREFYSVNGYDYYPFKGEYWLDEIGNYHYLGKQSCE